jgi:uncharacterized membrane protein YphA (DoxX/SURF4 family)
MDKVLFTLQIIVPLGIFNVWVLRFRKSTAYRGKSAQNLSEEFAAYGLPGWMVWVVGTLKLGSAVALLIGLWWPALVVPSAGLLVFLMAGAMAMHFKVSDPPKKFLPAFVMLALNVAIIGIGLAG